MATQVKLTLPTVKDFQHGEEAARELYNELEIINYSLDRIINHAHGCEDMTWPEDVEVDVTYIGQLYDFVETMAIETSLFVTFVERLRQQLAQLNDYRGQFEDPRN